MPNAFLFVEEGGQIHAVDDDFTLDPDIHRPGDLPPDPPGPNRATIFIPTDETTLNVGARWPGPHPASIDAGISGRTEHHAHFHAMGRADTTADATRTLLRLGIPTKEVETRDANAKSQDLVDAERRVAELRGLITQLDVTGVISGIQGSMLTLATGLPAQPSGEARAMARQQLVTELETAEARVRRLQHE